MRIASLIILCLALAAIPAAAADAYDNGPINGTTDAWTINFGYTVSDTFTLSQAYQSFSVDIGVWEFPGDTGSTVDWTISLTENGTGVGGTANVTDTFISTNQYGYNVDNWHFTTPVGQLSAGTYWLNLYNAVVPSGDPVYWDENSGVKCGGDNGAGGGCPSAASESAVGTIAGEAFTINATPVGPTTPEPSSIMLFGSGILGLAGVLRRKLF